MEATQRLTWTTVGREHSNTDAKKARILQKVDKAEWLEIPNPGEPALSLPFMQGYAIKEAVKQFRIPRVSHIFHTSALEQGWLLGIRGHYTNADVDLIFIDEGGDTVTPVVLIATDKKEGK